jgi:hypothetical protein
MVTPSFQYYSGKYALCPECKARPCLCLKSARLSVIPPAARVSATAIAVTHSGNAIPFTIWDSVIPAHQLTIYESGVLLYLCRRTIGYGKPAGALFSQRRIADALNISRGAADRALDGLAAKGLILVVARSSSCTMARLMSHIRVILPAA